MVLSVSVVVYLLSASDVADTKVCYLTQEPDPDEGNRLRWIQPFKDMCSCTSIRPGGLFKVAPNRKTKPIYTDQVIFTDDQEEIHDHYRCHFHGKWFWDEKKHSPQSHALCMARA